MWPRSRRRRAATDVESALSRVGRRHTGAEFALKYARAQQLQHNDQRAQRIDRAPKSAASPRSTRGKNLLHDSNGQRARGPYPSALATGRRNVVGGGPDVHMFLAHSARVSCSADQIA